MSSLQTQHKALTVWIKSVAVDDIDIDAVILDALNSFEDCLPGESVWYELHSSLTLSGNPEIYFPNHPELYYSNITVKTGE